MSTTVLLIEEDADNAVVCRALLERSGFDVIQAFDRESGVHLARERVPALIVVDVTVPGRDAVPVTRFLRSNPVTALIPLVALTDGDQHAARVRAREAGCHGYLPKRVAPEIAAR